MWVRCLHFGMCVMCLNLCVGVSFVARGLMFACVIIVVCVCCICGCVYALSFVFMFLRVCVCVCMCLY